MAIKFLYFDLGKVLVDFDVEVMFRRIGAAAGIEAQRVKEALYGDGLQSRYELGRISTGEFYEAFCRQTSTRPDFGALERAACDIFTLNARLLPVVAHLQQGGYRLGILSNTCENHWEHCLRRYRILEALPVHALSFRLGAAKPEAAIFRAAAVMAGVAPPEIFYVDDTPGHVAGARAVGFDAVPYTSTPQLVAELRQRGIRLNY